MLTLWCSLVLFLDFYINGVFYSPGGTTNSWKPLHASSSPKYNIVLLNQGVLNNF